jgi:predicted alpha/beta-fold hydrolase
MAKLARIPTLFDEGRMREARTLYEFDDAVTAPVHGFRDAHDYYSRSSSLGYLRDIRRPTLLLSARDDPFLPEAVLDDVVEIARENRWLTVEFHEGGGHVGFVGGTPWRPEYYAEARVGEFLHDCLTRDTSP